MDAGEDYEALRQKNIAANKALLASLGFDDVKIPTIAPQIKSKPSKSKKKAKKTARSSAPGGGGGAVKRKTRADDDGGDRRDSNSGTPVDDDSKRVKRDNSELGAPADEDAVIEDSEKSTGMQTRRSSRSVRRVNYSNDGLSTQAASTNIKSGSTKTSSSSVKVYDGELSVGIVDETKQRQVAKVVGDRIHDPKTYGHIPGIEIGTWFESRPFCSKAAIHAPFVAGIFGDRDNGAYSIALSGGYPDDVDLGEAFTYTGAGGRDLRGTKDKPKNLRTAPQSCDQSFDHHLNRTLKASVETGNPVRVIRGYKLPSVYAPREGYRYDGLYKVTKAWMENGLEGYKVCKYALTRLPGQPALPITKDDSDEEDEDEDEDEGDGEEDRLRSVLDR